VGGSITSVTIGRNKALILEGQSGLCPREGELFGIITARTAVPVRLI
jgi:hypothetical protein